MVDPYNISCSQTPLGLISLFSVLEQNKIEAEIIDLNYMYYKGTIKVYKKFFDNIQEIARLILKNTPEIVSIYSMCNSYYMGVLVGRKIKEISPNTVLIFAGPYASLVAKETLLEFSYVDYICLGEGENTIIGNIEGVLTKNEALLEGIAFRKPGEVVIKWDKHNRIDINTTPFVDICRFNDISDFNGVLSIEGGRGCPFSCSFCSTQFFWGNIFQVKSVERLLSEMMFYYKEYGVTDFSIQHDLFTLKRSYLEEFCNSG